jgi:hypothetical protein
MASIRKLVIDMSRYSDQQRDEILAEARTTLARSLTRESERQKDSAAADASLVDHLPPVEDRVAKWKREADEQEARFAAERRSEQDRAERECANAADLRIAELEDDVAELAKACAIATDALEHELAHVTRENLELKAALAKTETKLAELELALVSTGAVIDLPPLPRTMQ